MREHVSAPRETFRGNGKHRASVRTRGGVNAMTEVNLRPSMKKDEREVGVDLGPHVRARRKKSTRVCIESMGKRGISSKQVHKGRGTRSNNPKEGFSGSKQG